LGLKSFRIDFQLHKRGVDFKPVLADSQDRSNTRRSDNTAVDQTNVA